MLVTIYRCTIGQRHVDVGRMDTTKHGTVVGQIAPTDRERHVEGSLMEVMIAIISILDMPGITTDDTV